MNRKAFVDLLQSRVFGIIGYSVLVGLALLYLYFHFVNPPRRYDELNISCFVYRDTNRNGMYDLEDRPYAGLKIAMTRPKGGEVSAESNLAGFTNFPMSATASKALVRAPGRYTITAKPPANWIITSGNAVQAVTFKSLEDSPSGLAAEQTFTPVGVAPNLTVTGQLPKPVSMGESVPNHWRAVSPQGTITELPPTASRGFSFPANPGEWRIERTDASGTTTLRTFEVKNHPIVLPEIAWTPSSMQRKRNERLADFDTLTPSDTLYEIPNGYVGLNWTNWVATHQKLYNGAGYVNAAVSSEYIAYNSSGHPATIGSTRQFDFVGAHLTAAWPGAEKKSVVIKAWRDSELAYEDRVKISTAGPIYFAADYLGITRIEFSTEAYWQVAIDDFHFRTD